MRRRSTLLFGTAALAGVSLLTLSTSSGASVTSATITTRGTETAKVNVGVSSNLRFSPGQSQVRSGGTITLVHGDSTEDPHTLTIVNSADLPTGFEDILDCGAPGTICDEIFTTVGGSIVDPDAAQFINQAGGSGLDGRLDTIFLPPDTQLTVPVTATSGTTLHYMCAIHAWMQGTINVKG